MKIKILLIFFLLAFSVFGRNHITESKKYTGIYSWVNSARFRVYLQDKTDRLMISISEEGVYQLTKERNDTFSIDGLTGHEIAFSSEGDKIEGISWNLPSGKSFQGKRITKLDDFAIDVDSQLNEELVSSGFILKYAPEDGEEARKVFQALDSNYDRFREQFGFENLERITVKIYPSKLHYTIGINLPDRQSSIMSATEFGKKMICMTSPRVLQNTPYYEMSLSRGILHEFVHVLHRNYSDNAFNTGWLYEGVAIYTTKCCHNYDPMDIKYFKKQKRLPFKKFVYGMKKYEAGPFIVEFMDKVYGWDKVLKLLMEDGDIEKVFGKSQSAIESEFYDYLEKNYL